MRVKMEVTLAVPASRLRERWFDGTTLRGPPPSAKAPPHDENVKKPSPSLQRES